MRFRIIAFVRLIAAGVTMRLMQGIAHAESNDCGGMFDPPLKDNFKIRLGRIGEGAPRTHFIKSGYDAKGCPNASEACREKAFVVPGDRVILYKALGGFSCADFVGPKIKRNYIRSGWLPATSLVLEDAPPVAFADSMGKWSQIEASITIKPDRKPGMLSINGDATWGSLDPERVERGAVHLGQIEGTVLPKGSDLSFAMGENGTLPVTQGLENDCRVWMRRLGPYLLVDDNRNCGGMNVSFSGVYIRK